MQCNPVPTRPNERTPDFIIELAQPVVCEVKQIEPNEEDLAPLANPSTLGELVRANRGQGSLVQTASGQCLNVFRLSCRARRAELRHCSWSTMRRRFCFTATTWTSCRRCSWRDLLRLVDQLSTGLKAGMSTRFCRVLRRSPIPSNALFLRLRRPIHFRGTRVT